MRFASENELHRACGIIHQSLQSFFVTEQKRAPLVSGEAARKTDRQNFRVKNAIDVANGLRGFAQSLTALSLPIADKVNQAAFELLMCLPKLRVVNINDAAPKFGFGQVFLPVAEVFAVKRRKFRRHPGLGMNTICDAGYRHFVDRNAGPDIFPKRSTHFAVQFTDPIRMPAETQRQDGHAEWIIRIEARMTE